MIPVASIDHWYYAQNKKKMGPVSLAQLRGLLAEGVLKPADMVLQEGTQKWRPLAEIAGVMSPVKRPSSLGKKAITVGAVAGAAMVLLALISWGAVALLGRPNKVADVASPGPVAEVARDADKAEGKETERGVDK